MCGQQFASRRFISGTKVTIKIEFLFKSFDLSLKNVIFARIFRFGIPTIRYCISKKHVFIIEAVGYIVQKQQ